MGPHPDAPAARTYTGTKVLLEAIQKAGSVKVDKLIPAMEGMHQKNINGDIYLRLPAITKLQIPMPVVTLGSTEYPYFGVPTLIPASTVEIERDGGRQPEMQKKISRHLRNGLSGDRRDKMKSCIHPVDGVESEGKETGDPQNPVKHSALKGGAVRRS